MSARDCIHILHAEDDPMHAELFRRVINRCTVNAAVTHVTDGDQALDYLYQRGQFTDRKEGHPDLIVLDLNMPSVTGPGVLTTIKADPDLQQIPVVILSATHNDHVQEKHQSSTCRFLVKPTDYGQWTQMIETLCHKWQ